MGQRYIENLHDIKLSILKNLYIFHKSKLFLLSSKLLGHINVCVTVVDVRKLKFCNEKFMAKLLIFAN